MRLPAHAPKDRRKPLSLKKKEASAAADASPIDSVS